PALEDQEDDEDGGDHEDAEGHDVAPLEGGLAFEDADGQGEGSDGGVADHEDRPQEGSPLGEEGEDRNGGEGGFAHGDDDAQVDAPWPGSVDAGGVVDVFGQAAE